MNDLRKTQSSFARKAQAQPTHRFGDLYHFVCQEEWLREALRAVLTNTGSRTAGIDGISRKHLETDSAQTTLTQNLRTTLQKGTYQPQPVRRHWIPKPNGQQRPLGIPTLTDRVVQMVLKMLLEPIWESDFLECSNGFRPGRCTMDCIRTCQSRITTQNKYLWVIEGDIKGCFDHVHHAILLNLVKQRIRDERILALITTMLKAGVMDGTLFRHTPEGTPQGGILSPLLANIYLHELDCWWWDTYGKLTPYQKYRRRLAGVGNCILTRYADDFLLLCNGPRSEVERLREETRHVLWTHLHLELTEEKTHITHVTEGFDFLGYHVQWQLPKEQSPWLRVTPSTKSMDRFKRTIKSMTRRTTFYQAPLDKLESLNRVMRGWNNYYTYVNATSDASSLTYWANDRFFRWLKHRHKRGARWVIRTYRHRERVGTHDRWNLGVKDEHGELVYLYQLTDLHRRIYYPRVRPHPYLTDVPDTEPFPATPFPVTWEGQTTPEKAAWAELRLAVLERDGYCCTRCGRTTKLHIHHRRSRRHGGSNEMDNLQTLCGRCHMQTTAWGRPRGTRNGQSRRAG
jgi:group II intron reverse transcriptase/maturase